MLPQTRITVIQPLSICKLYRLYKEWGVNEDVTPVLEYVYSEIVNTETSILFHKPKSDPVLNVFYWRSRKPTDLWLRKTAEGSKEDTMQQWAADQANTNPNTLVIAYHLDKLNHRMGVIDINTSTSYSICSGE